MKKVVYVSWGKYERKQETGPDGCSLHLTQEEYREFMKRYWNKMPDEVPDEYSKPAGSPVAVRIHQKLYHRIQKSNHGLRLRQRDEKNLVGKDILIYGEQRSGWVNGRKVIFFH